MSKINWRLELGVQSGEYKLPQGLDKDDYTPMGILKEVADEVISNHNKLIDMKEKLEANSIADQWVRFAGSVMLVCATLIGLLVKIKNIKKGVQTASGMVSVGQPVVQSVQSMRPGSGIYSSSF